jgi:release factor glutamine methyltransferase
MDKIKTKQLIADGARMLNGTGITEPLREAESLLIHVCAIRREAIYSDDPELSGEDISKYHSALKRRAEREPFHYITGIVEFDGFELKVGSGVLVPRPETEMLVVEVAQRVSTPKRILDLCTGSGCIALSLARRFPEAEVTGTDISADALMYANENAKTLGIENVEFLEGEGFAPVNEKSFDLIVSNPPYIAEGDMAELEPEVAKWEPRVALVPGPEGLEFYRKIAHEAGAYMENDAFLALELGIGQADAVCGMLEVEGFSGVETVNDLSGIERMLFCFYGA